MSGSLRDPYVDMYLATARQRILALPEGETFMTAEIQDMMREEGWKDLPEPRVWGSFILALRRAGLVRKSGVEASPARSHGGVGATWCRTGLQG